ncbi:MAG: hypothetical protein QMD85_00570, partial [Candidatus Aenigmarchaeota archaeon]|nr:hypothetical protein [Candidatus Aenigmarchaeota archaeon]
MAWGTCGCASGYHEEDGACVYDIRAVGCDDKPANTKWNGASSYTQRWSNGWPSKINTEYSTTTGTCKYVCDDSSHREGDACVSNTKSCTAPCTNGNGNTGTQTWAVAQQIWGSCSASGCASCNTGFTKVGSECRANSISCTASCTNGNGNTGTQTLQQDGSYSACSASGCSSCSSGYHLDGTSCVAYACTGTTPSNAALCSGDDSGLTADTAKTLASSCGTSKCEYTCNTDFTKIGSECRANSIACTATCVNGNGNTGTRTLLQDGSYNACSASGCVSCNTGYRLVSGTCIQNICTGTTPSNAALCSGDDSGLTADTAKTLASSCGTAKCEYTCSSGYYKSGTSCVAYACTGTTPSNAALCSGDDSGLTADTAKTLASSCGTAKCEYTCSSGYHKNAAQTGCDPDNTAPTITDITAKTINEDTSTGAISFTIGDVETAPDGLTLSGSSSNKVLVPDANIVFGGAASSRTVTVTPVADKSGTATITITVSDGTTTRSDTFIFIVVQQAPSPTISPSDDTRLFTASVKP